MRHENNNMGNCVIPLVLALLAAAPALAGEESVMVLEGIAAGPYDNGDFTVFDPTKAWNMATREEWLATAKEGERPPMEDVMGAIAQVRIGADRTFRVEIPADKPRRVRFAVLNAVTPTGGRLAPMGQSNYFILEPGEFTVEMIRSEYSIVRGGYYNDEVINSWRLSEEYLEAQQEYTRLRTPPEDEPEEARRRRVDRLVEMSAEIRNLDSKGFEHVARTHPDPMVRRVAIETAWSSGPWVMEALRQLAALTPDDPWASQRIARIAAAYANRPQSKLPQVGETAPDFTGETLEGEEVHTAEVRADSRYLLVEFWASWCGPCRVEIPHMKQAYDRFREKGFEIVSFTIDDVREDWEEASAEENMPWFDLGMGTEAEAPMAYDTSTTGVPRNFLVDAGTQEIVARDLRQHKLDEKLEELLE
jgi:thiol-disulfide isomerase/thioredoxin/predicted transcriptional regulator